MLSTEVVTRWGLEEEDLIAMTQEAWQAFGIELEPAPPEPDAQTWCSRIVLEGPRGGVLVFCAERSLVEQAARHILRGSDAPIPEDLSQDTLNEIGNILGGTIKGCLEEEHQLSLPQSLSALPEEIAGAARLSLRGYAGHVDLYLVI